MTTVAMSITMDEMAYGCASARKGRERQRGKGSHCGEGSRMEFEGKEPSIFEPCAWLT